MADIAASFAALEQMDERGRKALAVACLMWEERWRDTALRAERAEWLLMRLQKWATGWGLSFDLAKAAAQWDTQHPQLPSMLMPWFEDHLVTELRDLRGRLDEALDGRERAEMHVETLEAELRRLREKVAG